MAGRGTQSASETSCGRQRRGVTEEPAPRGRETAEASQPPSASPSVTPPLVLAAPLSLTGRYAAQGRLAAAGLASVVEDIRSLGGVLVGEERREPRLLILDDRSTRAGVTGTLDAMGQTDLLIGPYGSDLVAEAAGWAASRGRVLWNHGGNADDVQRLPGLVSIGSPASSYLGPVLEALTELLQVLASWWRRGGAGSAEAPPGERGRRPSGSACGS